MKVPFLYLVCLLLVMMLACNGNNSELNYVYNTLGQTIPQDRLELFANSELDSPGSTIEIIRPELEAVFLTLSDSSPLRVHLDTLLPPFNKVKEDYLAIGFHYYINHRPMNFDSMKREIRKLGEYTHYKHVEDTRNKKVILAKQNDSIYGIGDSIKAYLLYSGRNGGKLATHHTMGFLSMESKSDSTSTFPIIGVIVGKGFGDLYPSGKDSTEYVFQIKLLEKSRNDVLINQRQVQVGDTFDLNVTGYGAILDRP